MPPKEEEVYLKKEEEVENNGGNNIFRSLMFRRQTSSTVAASVPAPKSATSSSDGDGGSSRSSSSSSKTSSIPYFKKGETVVSYTDDSAPFVICNSPDEFSNPTALPLEDDGSGNQDGTTMSYEEYVNSTLNLNLGLGSILKCRSQLSLRTIRILEFLDIVLLSWWESLFFYFWSKIMPIPWKRTLNRFGWKAYCKLHTLILGKSTGIHPMTSVEYHAITTAMWVAQFFIITPKRIRFSLGEQHTIALGDMPPSDRIEHINVDMRSTDNKPGSRTSSSSPSYQFLSDDEIPDTQRGHCHVRGTYINCNNNNNNIQQTNTTTDCDTKTKQKKKKILFWFYGGAYLGGDVLSNTSIANEFGQDCQVDVFIPEFRLAPESTIDDVLWDVCLAYLWVLRRADYDGNNVCLYGLSSGGALAIRLLQLIAERHKHQPQKELTPSFLALVVDKMTSKCAPRCAMFLGPYIDYTLPKKGSFLHYAKHDLVVTEAVQDYGLPYLNGFIPRLGDDLKNDGIENNNNNNNDQPDNATGRKIHSPVHRSFNGMSSTSLCFVVSEHEVTYDMTVEAANKARAEGCDVTVAVWKYMCHVWPCLQAMVPEGKQAMDFSKQYVRIHMED
mmetsp:Transcript_1044/g.2267  ORF Transcript_1044/g.2267 Transcript_1044/m.2267 type:complete len:613 (+) Transcript_1044:60-1898(+)